MQLNDVWVDEEKIFALSLRLQWNRSDDIEPEARTRSHIRHFRFKGKAEQTESQTVNAICMHCDAIKLRRLAFSSVCIL